MPIDYSNGFHYVLALLPELVLSIVGMFILVRGAGASEDGGESNGLGWVALAGVGVAATVNGWLYFGVSEVGTAGMIAVDAFRLFANFIFLLGAGFTIAVSQSYVMRQRLQAAEFYALILFATVGMMFMASSRDLLVIFLALETMSVGIYALVGFNRRDRRSAEAGLKYFLLGAFASGFLLFGIALIYGATGSTHVREIAAALQTGAYVRGFILPGMAMLLVGFAFKVSAIPFHMWTPDVYEGAPTPVSGFMAASVKAAAFIAFLRVFLVGLDGLYDDWGNILWWIAAVTMIVANLIALQQDNVKRMLAYSSIAHGGYLLVALVAANDQAVSGLLFYLFIYTVMNIGAFAVVMTIGNQSESRLQIEDYSGFGWRQPALGVMMTIFLLSLAGFPGTGGFMAKIFLLNAAADANLWYLMVILVLTTVASYWYYLRVAWYMWMRTAPEGQEEIVVVPVTVRLALLVAVGVLLLTGIFPGGLLDFAIESAEGLRQISVGAAALP